MPVRTSPGRKVAYYLICFDESGNERLEDDGTRLSDRLVEELASDGKATDVFLISHGWNNDVAGAIASYDHWIDVMASCDADRADAEAAAPGFTPVIVGIHWPSLAYGDEAIPPAGNAAASTDDGLSAEAALPPDALVRRYATRIADGTDDAAEAVNAIVGADDGITVTSTPPAGPGGQPTFTAEVSPDLTAHFQSLFEQSGAHAEGPTASPGNDTPDFHPEQVLESAARADLLGEIGPASATQPALLGPFSWIGANLQKAKLVVLRELSFWHMKALARTVGESGVHDLVQRLQAATGARFHLMGHSFGCIVVTAATCGPAQNGNFTGTSRKISSLFLVQGAMSLWSFADKGQITGLPAATGFYQGLAADGLVDGPFVTTKSAHDSAVGTWYPLGAGLDGDAVLFAEELPKYGGLGTFGIRGRTLPADYDPDGPLLDENDPYDFSAGQVYNLNATAVITGHSQIAFPRVAHAFWQAAISTFPGQRP
jgi:hypothetical protein